MERIERVRKRRIELGREGKEEESKGGRINGMRLVEEGEKGR